MTAIARPTVRVQLACLLVAAALGVSLLGCNQSRLPAKVDAAEPGPEQQVPSGGFVLKGAGATFPSLLYKRWFTVYHDNHPDTFVKYAAVGSGDGVRRFIGKDVSGDEQVEFGASDAAMSDAQLAATDNNTLMVPATAGCVVLAYNLPAFSGELKLSRKAYAGIFLGEITNLERSRHRAVKSRSQVAQAHYRYRGPAGRQRYDLRLHPQP